MKHFTLAVVVLALFSSLLFWVLADKEEPKVFAAEAVPATTKATSSPAERSNIPTTSDRPAASLPECPQDAISAEWLDQHFQAEYFPSFQRNGLLPEDAKLLIRAVADIGIIAALPDRVVDKDTVVFPGKFQGETIESVLQAAQSEDPEAAYIAGVHLLSLSTLLKTMDIHAYEKARDLLLTSAERGNIKALYGLRQTLFFLSKAAWRKVSDEPTEAYRLWKRDFLTIDRLVRRYGNEGAYLLSLNDEHGALEGLEELYRPRSASGLPEPEYDPEMTAKVDEYFMMLDQKLPFRVDGELQQRKERIAWLNRNKDLLSMVEQWPEICRRDADKSQH